MKLKSKAERDKIVKKLLRAAEAVGNGRQYYSCIAAYHQDRTVLYPSPTARLYQDLLDPRNANQFVGEGEGRLSTGNFDTDFVTLCGWPDGRTVEVDMIEARSHRVMALLSAAEYVKQTKVGEELF